MINIGIELDYYSIKVTLLSGVDLRITGKTLGSGCGSVGRAIASDTRGLQFESGPRQTLNYFYTVNCMYMDELSKTVMG